MMITSTRHYYYYSKPILLKSGADLDDLNLPIAKSIGFVRISLSRQRIRLF